MRIGLIAVALAAALFAFAVGCDLSPSEEPAPPPAPPPPCADVYDVAVNTCVAQSGCAGFGCVYVWEQCGADAKRGPLMDCCVANYQSAGDRQTCIDTLGQEPAVVAAS